MYSNIVGQKGFTLLEILCVVLILGILGTLAVTGLYQLIDYFILEAAQNKLYNEIRQAKMQAIKTEELSRISFPFIGVQNNYVVMLPGEGTSIKTLPAGLEFCTVNTGGFDPFNSMIIFTANGTPRWGGAKIGISNSRGDSRYIVVAAVSGRVRKTK
ncbi:prepilin-type N-terminal cleavage/methylation domain-containing protein [Natranaerobius thermophilus]|uniref:N-terminal methylation n=1 Tax=Natranaerobius thermophilus (strain ATCC BAA-1301 / DSM 18059 / JW/NM-WN-LF) TaxID=457570 RepID=B2A555_NATTJ|nr:prepilin-type N-terminal cleavage/methylation domain-containing protein [Natranaerobius thermophilus]ACB85297.1 N-terminal methylation [Natranaerobius thermophilus JW/NM-WN-LF]